MNPTKPYQLSSMTAFAMEQTPWGDNHLTLELRSVNHRFLDFSLKLPEVARFLEPAIRRKISETLIRGRVEIQLTLRKQPDHPGSFSLDQNLLSRLMHAVDVIGAQSEFDLPPPSALDFLKWPGIIQEHPQNPGELELRTMSLVDQTLSALVTERKREGQSLAKLIDQRCDALLNEVSKARAHMLVAADHFREKTRNRILESLQTVDEMRLEQELIHYAQKIDVLEEMDRLEAHGHEIKQILLKNEAAGKRLDFLTQELHREANTLGAKSQDLEMTRASLAMKVLIEQIKEQVQNIE